MNLARFLITLLGLLFSALFVKAGPADFVADQVSGCSPLVVHFHPLTPCGTCTYSWNFGNATPLVPGDTVSTSYIAAGTYTVTLTVHQGASVFTQTKVISVLPVPVVNFSVDDTSLCPGESVVFTSTSSSSVPGSLVHSWSCGDGTPPGIGATLSHVYAAPGYFNVTLVVTNASGCSASLTKTAYVHVNSKPVFNFNASPLTSCPPPINVTFASSATGNAPFTYAWKFGDGGASGAPNPVYTYNAADTYSVQLVIIDAKGCRDTVKKNDYIRIENVVAAFTYPDSLCLNTPIIFTNTSSPHLTRFWDYGEGGAVTSGFNGHHTYTTAGTYTVTLAAYIGICNKHITHVIHVAPHPAVDFTTSPEHPCPSPVSVTYAATGTPTTEVWWIIDSAMIDTMGSAITYDYDTDCVHTVTMIRVDPASGCRDTVTKKDTIYSLAYAGYGAFPEKSCVPFTIYFGWQASTTEPSASAHPYPYGFSPMTWDFGDGSPPVVADSPAHLYTSVGEHWAIVSGTTLNGCEVRDTVRVNAGDTTIASFTAAPPLHMCKTNKIPIVFTATPLSDSITGYYWDFGDGPDFTTSPVKAHIYTIPGIFTVTMTPYFRGRPGIPVELADTVRIDSPKAIISLRYNCDIKNSITFGDSSLGDDSHLWMFGDTVTSTLDHPIHDYDTIKGYLVMLATYNIQSGCRDTARLDILLQKLDMQFAANDTDICKNGTVTIISDTNKTAEWYSWYINGEHYTKELPMPLLRNINPTFDTPGRYTIQLATTDIHQCVDTFTRPDFITVGKPMANFTVTTAEGCAPFSVTFIDISVAAAGLTPSLFGWNFGDGHDTLTDTIAVTHTYTAAGVYTVSDTVTDNIGCKDTASHPDLITIYKPLALFYADTKYPCLNVPDTFRNITPDAVSSEWAFGDGGISTSLNAAHAYTATGVYSASLTTTDLTGCTTSIAYPNYIIVEKPSASFSISDSTAICTPHRVYYFNSSFGADNYTWSFGDGNSSIAPNPENLYAMPGLYYIRLISATAHGCSDTAYDQINIFGYSGAFSYSPDSGCVPLSVHFTATFTNAPNIVWDFGDGNTSVATTLDTASHIYTLPGLFVPKLILSDDSGCVNSAVGADTIKADAVRAKFGTVPHDICAGSSFVLMDSSSSHLSAITARTWLYDGNTSHAISPFCLITTPGIYPVHLSVTDGWGCMDTLTKNIPIYALPDVTTTPDTLVCANDSATLAAYGATAYTWTPSATLSCANCSVTKAMLSSNTTYTVTGTDIRGCKDTTTVNVSIFTADITGPQIACEGTILTLTNLDTGGMWQSSDSAVAIVLLSNAHEGIVTGMAEGTATISYVMSGSCLATTVVTINPLPDTGAINGATDLCISAADTLTATIGGGSWSGGNVHTTILPITTGGIVVTAISEGADTINYTLTNGCGMAIATKIVTVNPTPVISGIAPICPKQFVSIIAIPDSGRWLCGDTAIASIDTLTGIAIGKAIMGGNVIITYTTIHGCRDTATLWIYAIPGAGIIGGPDTMCTGSTFTLHDTATQGMWSSSNTGIALIGSASGIVHAIDTGTASISYITAPNAAGCADTSLFDVTIIAHSFSFTATTGNVSCFGSKDGSISVLPSGGSAPLAYQWSNGGASPAVNNLDTGMYYVVVSDMATQCFETDTFTITSPDSLHIAVEVKKDLCKNGNGSITATVSGGTPPYQYHWSNNRTGLEDTALSKGRYSFSVTDSNGCFKELSIDVEDSSCTMISVHNGISPNGDGINDTWVIEGIENYPDNNVQVFDKWGDLLFERTGYNNDWDGNGKNGRLPDGTYYYVIKLNKPDVVNGDDVLTGAVLIKR